MACTTQQSDLPGLVEKLTDRLAAIELEKSITLDLIHDFMRNSVALESNDEPPPLAKAGVANSGGAPAYLGKNSIASSLGGASSVSGYSMDTLQSVLSQKAAQLGKIKAKNALYEDSIVQRGVELSELKTELAEENSTLNGLKASASEQSQLLQSWQQEQEALSRRAWASAELREQVEQRKFQATLDEQIIESMQREAAAQAEELTRVAEEQEALDSKMPSEASMLQAELRHREEEIEQRSVLITSLRAHSESISMAENQKLAELHESEQELEELRRKVEERAAELQSANSSTEDLKCQLAAGDQDCHQLRCELARNSEQLRHLKHECALWKKHQQHIGSIEERVSALKDVCQITPANSEDSQAESLCGEGVSDADSSMEQTIEPLVSGIIQELGFGRDAAEVSNPRGALGSILLASSAEAAVARVQEELQTLVPYVVHALTCAQHEIDWTEGPQIPHAEFKKGRDEVPSVREALLEIWKVLPRNT